MLAIVKRTSVEKRCTASPRYSTLRSIATVLRPRSPRVRLRIDGVVDGEEEPILVMERWAAEHRVGAVHAVPGELGGDGPVDADLEHVAGLHEGAGMADGVCGEDLLRERHRMRETRRV